MAAKQMVAEIHAEVPETAVVPVMPNGDVSVSGLLQMAVAHLGGVNPDAVVGAMERLVGLHERMEAKAAEKAFNRAMTDFQARCPQILKATTAKITSKRTGSQYSYKFAELDQIDDAIRPLMTELGLTKRFTTEKNGNEVTVTCIISHIDGHSISSPFSCPIDTEATMSATQQSGAAITFAKRYALIAALGLTTTETDTDAQIGVDRSPQKISQDQAADIEALITEVGAVRGKFLGYFDVTDVADLTLAQFPKAVQMLEAKRKKVA